MHIHACHLKVPFRTSEHDATIRRTIPQNQILEEMGGKTSKAHGERLSTWYGSRCRNDTNNVLDAKGSARLAL